MQELWNVLVRGYMWMAVLDSNCEWPGHLQCHAYLAWVHLNQHPPSQSILLLSFDRLFAPLPSLGRITVYGSKRSDGVVSHARLRGWASVLFRAVVDCTRNGQW